MSIVAFIDTPNIQHDLAIELAATLAEFAIEEHELLYLLADAVTALEVGLSLIGSRGSRTVEGGEYHVSPVTLLPFIPRPNSLDDNFLRKWETDTGGDISEFYELGLFARPGERDGKRDFGDEPATALARLIETERPLHIVGLGEDSVYWTTISEAIRDYRPRIVMIDGFGSEHVKAPHERLSVARPEVARAWRKDRELSREVDELEELRFAAARDGALVAGFLQLLIDKMRHDGESHFGIRL